MNQDFLESIFEYPNASEYTCIEFGHPLFDRIYRITPSTAYELTVTHEDSGDVLYLPLQVAVNLGDVTDELEQTLDVTIGGMSDDLEDNLNRVISVRERPYLNYRRYRKNLLTRPIVSLLGLRYIDSSETKGKCTFRFSTPKLNQLGTADIFTFDRCRDLDTFI